MDRRRQETSNDLARVRAEAPARVRAVAFAGVHAEAFPAILTGVQAGDEDQFAILWRAANPAILRYLRVLAPEDAWVSAAAETWIQVIRGLSHFNGDELAWRAWLFTTARRRMIDQTRYVRRHPAKSLEKVRPTDPPQSENNLATDAAIAVLTRLAQMQADVILLRILAGLDTNSVAEMIGKSPGYVRVSAHRGLKNLEAIFERAGVTAGVVLPSESDTMQAELASLSEHADVAPPVTAILTGLWAAPTPAELAGEDAARATFRMFVPEIETVAYSRPDKASEVRSMPVSIYVSDESVRKQVEAAVRQWLAAAGTSIDKQASLLWHGGFDSSGLSGESSARHLARKCS